MLNSGILTRRNRRAPRFKQAREDADTDEAAEESQGVDDRQRTGNTLKTIQAEHCDVRHKGRYYDGLRGIDGVINGKVTRHSFMNAEC